MPWRPGGQRYLADAEEKIQQNLARLASLNFITAPREAVERILEQDKLARQALLPGSATDPDLVRKATERLAGALEVQGFLIAVMPEERLQRTARLNLLAAGNTTAEAVDVAFGAAAAYTELLARVDAVFASERPWSGLVTVDTLLLTTACRCCGCCPGARRPRPAASLATSCSAWTASRSSAPRTCSRP